MTLHFVRAGYKLYINFSITHLFWFVVVKKSFQTVQQAVEQQGRERSVAVHKFALCVSHFLHSQETLILETDFLWQLLWAKTILSCSSLHTEKEQETEGGGNFETHLPHLTGCGALPLLHFLFYDHIFSLSEYLFFHLLNCCLSSSRSAHVSVQSAVCFFKCQHAGACLGGGVAQASAYSKGACRAEVRWNSQGPNINTACNTPSQHAFKTSEEVNIWASQCKQPVICWVYKTVKRNPTDPGLNPNTVSLCWMWIHTCRDYAHAGTKILNKMIR